MTPEQLIQVMDQYNMTAEEVARACYVSVHLVYKWRQGKSPMRKGDVVHLHRYIGENK